MGLTSGFLERFLFLMTLPQKKGAWPAFSGTTGGFLNFEATRPTSNGLELGPWGKTANPVGDSLGGQVKTDN